MTDVAAIAPGSRIQVKVVKQPTNAAARKTIVRLLSKDAGVRKQNDRLRRARRKNLRQEPRGGRLWDVNVPKQHPVAGQVGDSGNLTATLDVLSDLQSVSRFVQVSKA